MSRLAIGCLGSQRSAPGSLSRHGRGLVPKGQGEVIETLGIGRGLRAVDGADSCHDVAARRRWPFALVAWRGRVGRWVRGGDEVRNLGSARLVLLCSVRRYSDLSRFDRAACDLLPQILRLSLVFGAKKGGAVSAARAYVRKDLSRGRGSTGPAHCVPVAPWAVAPGGGPEVSSTASEPCQAAQALPGHPLAPADW